jgi:hypothetical protein
MPREVTACLLMPHVCGRMLYFFWFDLKVIVQDRKFEFWSFSRLRQKEPRVGRARSCWALRFGEDDSSAAVLPVLRQEHRRGQEGGRVMVLSVRVRDPISGEASLFCTQIGVRDFGGNRVRGSDTFPRSGCYSSLWVTCGPSSG